MFLFERYTLGLSCSADKCAISFEKHGNQVLPARAGAGFSEDLARATGAGCPGRERGGDVPAAGRRLGGARGGALAAARGLASGPAQ